MSAPRRVVPGQTHMLTRRCSERRLFLTPKKDVNATLLYGLAYAAMKSGVEVHAFQASTNHVHQHVTDPRGTLPDFARHHNGLTGRALNARYGRGEAFWCQGSYSNVELHGKEAALEKLLYVMTQCVKDGLVATPDAWPGIKTLPEDFGTTIVVKKPKKAFFGGVRPKDFQPLYRDGRRVPKRPRTFDPLQEAHKNKRPKRKSTLPDTIELKISVPPAFRDMPLEEFRAFVRERLDERVKQIHKERKALGLTRFMGAHAVRNRNPFDSAGDTFPEFKRDSRISCPRDAVRRIQILTGLKAWRQEYHLAREAWRTGNRKALFPYGTYWQRVFHKAKTRGSPSAPLAA